VTADLHRFAIRVSASRLEKGLLAVPQKFRTWFPSEKGQIQIIFDDEEKAWPLTFHPHDPVVKESRIFGLSHWFSKRNVGEGDLISITLEDPAKRLYRISLDRFIHEQEERKSRQKLRRAQTDVEAERELSALSRLTRKRRRRLAREELLRIAGESPRRPRPRVVPSSVDRYGGVPSGIRVLLRELHDGKCQLCSFTFSKRSGAPYFEIHHLDPAIGHHPSNLLVVCPNCHAQFEHASITDFTWVGDWLTSLRINGRRIAVRQPLAQESVARTLLALGIVVAAMQMGRILLR
jgi:5-methylcytosine-specific restriction endonuclease McrA